MTITHAIQGGVTNWASNWAWGLPLIGLTLIIHVFGLLLIKEKVESIENRLVKNYSFRVVFWVIIGGAAMSATLLHGAEGIIWAAAYRVVGALPDNSSAILYSLSAMTAYGHANLDLERQWQLMGALEALNGMLLFGLSTAALLGIIEWVWGRRGSP